MFPYFQYSFYVKVVKINLQSLTLLHYHHNVQRLLLHNVNNPIKKQVMKPVFWIHEILGWIRGSMPLTSFLLLFLHDDRRIRIRIREAQKHVDPMDPDPDLDPDPEHWMKPS
jgi:hypothetical protein